MDIHSLVVHKLQLEMFVMSTLGMELQEVLQGAHAESLIL